MLVHILVSQQLLFVVIIAFILDRKEDAVVWARGMRYGREVRLGEVLVGVVKQGLACPTLFIATAQSVGSTKHVPSS